MFEECKDIFPEEATIKCIEKRPVGYDVWIKAIPCNGEIECRNGVDEECSVSDIFYFSILVVFYFITAIIWIVAKNLAKKHQNSTCNMELNVKENETQCNQLIGDKLASLKVNWYHTLFKIRLQICSMEHKICLIHILCFLIE